MAYVITGSTGHIGNNLVRILCEKNEEVVALVRKTNKALADLKVKLVYGDLLDEKFLSANIHEGDIVVHLAGVIDVKNKLEKETYEVNYLLTKLVTDVSIKNKAHSLIYCSSVDAIYKTSEDTIIKEPETMFPDKFKDNYPHTKALGTEYVLKQMKEPSSTLISIVYPSAVIGPYDFKPSLIGKVVKDCILNKPEFGIKGGYNFIDVRDVATAIIEIAELNKSDTYIISGHNVTVKELYEYINKALNKNKKIMVIPKFLVYLSIPFVPYLSPFSLKTLLENHNYDNEKVREELGVTITPFDKTINDTVLWFMNNKEKE